MDEVKFFMAQDIISVSSKASATEVAQTMVDRRTGSVLIEKDGEYVGILTEGDLSQRVIAQLKQTIDVQAASIMSKPIISIESNQLMATAFLTMGKHRIRHIAVSENKKSSVCFPSMIFPHTTSKNLANKRNDPRPKRRSTKTVEGEDGGAWE